MISMIGHLLLLTLILQNSPGVGFERISSERIDFLYKEKMHLEQVVVGVDLLR